MKRDRRGQLPIPKRAPAVRWALILALAALAAPLAALDLADYELIDLSHAYGDDTLYWPTSPSKFEREVLHEGMTEGGFFYAANSVCTPEHGGTHLDAPHHFDEAGITTERIPLENLVAPAVVIPIAERAERDRNYRLTAEDVLAFESAHGEIPAGAIVLLHTGWSRFWPDALGYLGDDTPGDASKLEFPSYGAEAARLLVEERRVALLGVDTASIDYGRSTDFVVHRIAAARNVGGLENLTALDRLPATGAVVLALPMKIDGGSGGPVRVVAMVPK
jgi:kynurenine formamidase